MQHAPAMRSHTLTLSSCLLRHPTSPDSSPNSQTTSTESVDGNHLAFEPVIIKGKGGERLWQVEATKECLALCKSQLKVLHLHVTNNRMRRTISSSRLKPKRLLPTGASSLRVLIRGRELHTSSVAIVKPFVVILIMTHIRIQVGWANISTGVSNTPLQSGNVKQERLSWIRSAAFSTPQFVR